MKKALDFEDYKQCLLAGRNAFMKQLMFRDKKHKVHTIETYKLALSIDDNKQVIQSDGMHMLEYGHKKASAMDVFGT